MSRSKKKQKCNKYRKGRDHLTVVDTKEMRQFAAPELRPKNLNQDELIGLLNDDSVNIVFAIGPAGTGKTLLSTVAGIQGMKSGKYRKCVVSRPAVSVEEDHGALPGTLTEKMAPWTRPVLDIFREYYSPMQLEWMLESETLELSPLGYMRGRTFKDSFILLDEAQNTTPDQMKMALTRIGKGSKMVVTGDLDQFDRGYGENGLRDIVYRLGYTGSDRIKIVEFTKHDIERHVAVQEVLDMYND